MCIRLAGAVAAVVPDGVGSWGQAWTLTAESDRRWMRALAAWEENDTPATVAALRVAFDDVVNAWKTVTHLWKTREAA